VTPPTPQVQRVLTIGEVASRHYRERYTELAQMEREARQAGWTYYADELATFAAIACFASRAELRDPQRADRRERA
jgi:hypothetical protein